MVLCVDPLGLGFSDEDLVAVRHLCHTESSSVTSVQDTSWPGHLETGLCFISLLQLSSWETLSSHYVHGALLWLVVLGELTPLMEEGLPCLCPFRNGSLNHLFGC